MAAPAFGFSAGDFINAVNLIIDITKALKSVGGACDEYQALVTELGLLQHVLFQLQYRQSSSTIEHFFASYAKQQAEVTLSTLSQFLRLISKFEDALGHSTTQPWYKHVGKKTQWAIAYTKEVNALRTRIGSQLHVLNTILQLEERLSPSSSLILTTVEEIRRQNQAILQNTSLSVQTQGSAGEIKTFSTGTVDQNSLSLATGKQGSGFAAPGDIVPPGSSPHQTRQLVSSLVKGKKEVQSLGESETLAILLLKLIQVTARDLKGLLLRIWTFFPQFYIVIHELSIRFRGEPMLLVSDSINFEDMLGRCYTLQHAYYNYWPNFETFLRRKFQNFPGETFVTGGHYNLLSSRTRTSISRVHPFNWSHFSIPGCEVSMSVRVKLASADPVNDKMLDDCPWIECDGKLLARQGQDSFKCSTCNITYLFKPNDKSTPYCKIYPGFLQTESQEGKVRLGIVRQAEVFRRIKRTKRILRWEWICCACGLEGRDMGMLTVDCPARNCGHARCGNCPVQYVRRRRGAAVIEYSRNSSARIAA